MLLSSLVKQVNNKAGKSKAEPDSVLIGYSTYSLIKELVQAMPKDEITVKGFAKLIKTYQITNLVQDIECEKIFDESAPGFLLKMNLERMDDENKKEIKDALRSALTMLSD